MVAIVTGTGLGLERSSGWLLGSRGQVGAAGQGRAGDNVYVNAATGNLIIQQTDEVLVNPGQDNAVGRTYNSRTSYAASAWGFNDGWQLNDQRQVTGLTGTVNTAGSTVRHVAWDGSDILYTYDTAAGYYAAQEGAGGYDKLVYTSGNTTWTWTDGATRLVETYVGAAGGKLASSTDLNGNSLTYHYSGGLLVRVESSDGESIEFSYSHPWVTMTAYSASHQALNTTRYEYDSQYRLVGVTVDLTYQDNSVADGAIYKTSYLYDGASNRIAAITQSDGSSLMITYTLVGSDYRVASLAQKAADGDVRVTTLSYDTSSRITTITDPLGQQTQLWYDTEGRLTKRVDPAAQAGMAQQVSYFSYDGMGNVTRVALPDGTEVDYEYDAAGNRRVEIDTAGNAVLRTFGANNQVLTEKRYVVPGVGGVGLAQPVTARYAYTATNQLAYSVSPEGRVTRYEYDSRGLQTSAITYMATLYDVSALGEDASIATATLDTWVAGTADKTRSQRTDTTYDFRGNVSTVTAYETVNATTGAGDPAAPTVKTLYTYDAFGRLLTRQPVGGSTETFVYDGMGRLIASTDANSQTTSVLFDDAGSRTLVTHANGQVETSTYDLTGALIRYSRAAPDIATSIATYRYDAKGRLVMETDPTGGKTYHLYDAVDRKIADVTADGAMTEYQYSADDQLVQTIRYANKLSASQLASLDGGATGSMSIWRQDTSGAIGSTGYTSMGPEWRVAGAGDLNGDGRSDIVWRHDDGQAQVWYATATGFTSTSYGSVDLDWKISGVADFSGDGKADILWRRNNGQLGIWQPDAAGGRNGVNVAATTTLGEIERVGDFNGDGRADILWRREDGQTTLSFFSAGGGAQTEVTTAVGLGWNVIATGDFNGNGSQDILWRSTNGASSLLWEFSTAMVRTQTTASALGADWSVSQVGKFNGDGAYDILWRHNDGTVKVQFLNGAVEAAPSQTLSLSREWLAQLPIDMNNDGRHEVFWINKVTGEIVRWQFNASGGVSSDSLGTISKDWRTQGRGDFNADGAGELLWRYLEPITIAHVRPTASSTADRREIRIYDQANRLIETIDEQGAVTTYAYDGLSRLVSTTAYATQLSSTALAAARSTPPTSLVLPTADGANDRVTRQFYDKDGLLIGALDAEGYLTQVLYDGAGQKLRTIRYATATTSSLRAAGTLAQLVTSAGTSASDVHEWSLYDSLGHLRAEIDAEGNLTRYHYDAFGTIDQIIRGQKLDPAPLIATPPTLATLPAAGGSEVLEATGFTRNQYGDVLTETRTLAGGVIETTTYVYDVKTRLLLRKNTAVGTTDARTLAYKYDGAGRLVGALNGVGAAALAALGSTPDPVAWNAVWTTYGTTYAYDNADRLASKTEAATGRTAYYYDADGRLVYAINSLGETTEYRYDAFGERSDVITYAARISASNFAQMMGGPVVGWVVSAVNALANAAKDGKLHTDYNVTGTVSATVDGVGAVTSYSYNAFGDVVGTNRQLDATTGTTTTLTYDRRGLMLSELKEFAAGPGGNAARVLQYDAFGRAVMEWDARNILRTTSYDRAGRIVATYDGFNRATTYQRDGRGNVVSMTDRLGNTTLYTYDAFNRHVTVTTPEGLTKVITSNAYGQETLVTDAAGRQTISEYDADGHQTLSWEGAGSITYAYNAAGQLIAEDTHITGPNPSVHYQYDGSGRLWKRIVDEGGLNLTTTYAYDGRGQTVSITDPTGSVTTIAYDQEGQKTTVVVDAGGAAITTNYVYDLGGRTLTVHTVGTGSTTYTYDKLGRMLSSEVHIDGPNPTTSYTYDKAGNVVLKTDGLGNLTIYGYDAENRLTSVDDARGTTTTTTYDAEGRVIATTVEGLRDFNYVYDKDGRLRFTVDANRRPVEYIYDASGNVIQVAESGGVIPPEAGAYTYAYLQAKMAENSHYLRNVDGTRITRNVYDAAGRKTYTIDGAGAVIGYVYDGASRVVKELKFATLYTGSAAPPTLAEISSWASSSTTGADETTNYYYDNAGRVLFVVDSLKQLTGYAYDANGQVTRKVRYAPVFDIDDSTSLANVQLMAASTPAASAAVTRYAYDGAGRLRYEINPEGEVVGYLYDAVGNLAKETRFATLYDETRSGTLADLGSWASTSVASNTGFRETWYYYDGANRLAFKVDGDKRVTQYVYDIVGHVIREIRYAGWYNVDSGTTLASLTALVGTTPPATAQITNYAYDEAGRVEFEVDGQGAVKTYVYDAFGVVRKELRFAVLFTGTSTTLRPCSGSPFRLASFPRRVLRIGCD